MAYVYFHRKKTDNSIFYVGIGSENANYKRAHSLLNRNKHWHNTCAKHGKIVEIMHDDLTWVEACEKEKEYIKEYGRKDNDTGILLNMTDGGDGAKGVVVTKETRDKMRISSTGRPNVMKGKKWSKEYCENMKKAVSGKPNPFAGRKHTAESLLIIGAKSALKIPWNKGKKMSKEFSAKISAGLIGKTTGRTGIVPSAETRAKISASWKNRVVSDETKMKQSIAGKKRAERGDLFSKPVFCIELNKTFPSGVNASLMLGLSKSAVGQSILKNRKVLRIYTFKYAAS